MSKIYGVGADLIKNSRMESILLKSYNSRFIARVLHSKEIDILNEKNDIKVKAAFLSSRWAYKEALVKASGRKDLVFSAMFLKKNENGKPFIEFEDVNRRILEEIKVRQAHVSISHEDEYSMAFIVLET